MQTGVFCALQAERPAAAALAGGGPVTCRNPEECCAVVVGSGFGGSVTAFRLAQKGWSVLVLERGRPWPPGSFPRTPPAMGHALWDPPQRFGMFDVWSFTGINAVAASGLGGGSLIYANVLMPAAPASAFFHEDGTPWPVGRVELEERYVGVGDVLNPVPYPEEHRSTTPKTQAMAAAAEAIGRSGSRRHWPWRSKRRTTIRRRSARAFPTIPTTSSGCRAARAGSAASVTSMQLRRQRTRSTTPTSAGRAPAAPCFARYAR